MTTQNNEEKWREEFLNEILNKGRPDCFRVSDIDLWFNKEFSFYLAARKKGQEDLVTITDWYKSERARANRALFSNMDKDRQIRSLTRQLEESQNRVADWKGIAEKNLEDLKDSLNDRGFVFHNLRMKNRNLESSIKIAVFELKNIKENAGNELSVVDMCDIALEKIRGENVEQWS